MKIGILLRAYDRPGGIGIYSRNIVKHLLRHDKDNHYVLFYSNPQHLGTYADNPRVEEEVVPAANPVLWDQWLAKRALDRHKVDLVFNTKFSVPLTSRFKRVMALHGASWFVHPELYGKFDIFYVNRAVPVYCKASDFLVSNSDLTTNDFIRILKVPPQRIKTVQLAAGEEFKPVTDAAALQEVRQRYALPERFVLTVTSYDPRKNFGNILKAFEGCRKEMEVKLLVVGKNCHRYGEDFALAERGLADEVIFPGWVEQKDLPALYSLAAAFIFPSVYEEFGIPVVEAMACGCPIVSSSTGAIPELVGDAALLCHPTDVATMTEHLRQVLSDSASAQQLRAKGLERAQNFSWDKAATQTMDIFNNLA
jgi:glycosyltransferase involved in cell wall biosynthesis